MVQGQSTYEASQESLCQINMSDIPGSCDSKNGPLLVMINM